MSSSTSQQPKTPGARSTAVTVSFITLMGLNGLAIVLYTVMLVLLSVRQGQIASVNADSGESPAGNAVMSAIRFISGLMIGSGYLEAVLNITCAVIFLIWVSNAFHVMRALRPNLINTSRGFVVGGFFVPLVNIVHGYNMVKELWSASNPAATDTEYYIPTRLPALMNWWWGFFLIDGVMGYAMAAQKGDTIDSVKGIMCTGIVDSAITIAAAILAVRVVQITTARINECGEHSRIIPPPATPPDGDAD